MIRSLRRLSEDAFLDAGKAVVEHHYDNHEYCGQWCPRRRLTDHEKNLSEKYYRSKVNDAKLLCNYPTITARFITLPKLKDVAHVMDTQVNESMNNTISWLAPKNKCFGGSQSLLNRISIAVGITSLGLNRYFTRLFHALGITMMPNIHHFLSLKENKRQKRLAITKDKEHKRLPGRRISLTNSGKMNRSKGMRRRRSMGFTAVASTWKIQRHIRMVHVSEEEEKQTTSRCYCLPTLWIDWTLAHFQSPMSQAQAF
jgi:hypothetical protein